MGHVGTEPALASTTSNGPSAETLPDHASAADARGTPIHQVGIRRLRYPIQVKDKDGTLQATVAEVSMSVGLPANVTGTHMSRFIEVLNAERGEVTIRNLPDILARMQRRLGAETARIELSFPYFIRKRAPVSGAESLLEIRSGFVAERTHTELDFALQVEVPVTTLCPCSKAVSEYGAHNQRGVVSCEVRSTEFVWIEDVTAAVEGCASAPLYALLKRSDEKFVTEQAYDNPRFVEDMVREVTGALRALPGVTSASVVAENFESIHNHTAFAEVAWSKQEGFKGEGLLAAVAVPGETAGAEEVPDFGAWLRLLRRERGVTQGELASIADVTPSFVSRVEAGQKTASPEVLERWATLLGQEPTVFSLRAGVVSRSLTETIARYPESFLEWSEATGN